MAKSKGSRSALARRECGDAPQLAHQRVIFVAGVAEVVHPVKVVVAGVVDAVVAVESQADHRHTDEV